MKKVFALFVGVALAASTAFASGTKESNGKKAYTVAGSADWPPLEYVDESGTVVGFEVDLLKAIAESQNVSITFQNVAWDGIFAGLANNAYDGAASGISVTEERKQSMDFTTTFLTITQAIIAPKEHPELTDTKSLAGKTVGTQIGTTGDLYLQDQNAKDPTLKITDKAYDSVGLAVEDLLNGNLDAVVTDSVVAIDFVFNNKNYNDKLVISGTASKDGELIAMAVKKGNKEVLDMLNAGIAQAEKDGTMDKLKKQYHLE